MHWTYDSLDTEQLHQGDVLSRTPEISRLLEEIHPYFYSRAANAFFMVLTQTCDLVRRPEPKSDYIAICPVRPLENVLVRSMKKYVHRSTADIPVGTIKDQTKFRDFLSRLFNNNESGLFYLERDGTALAMDYCAITRLSISIKSEHYEKCLAAKKIQLSEPFRAKLGWSVGNVYSRIGTRDWDNAPLQAKISAALDKSIVWVRDDAVRQRLIAELDVAAAAGTLDDRTTQKLKKALSNTKADLVALVAQLMTDAGVGEAHRQVVGRRLAADPKLTQLLKA